MRDSVQVSRPGVVYLLQMGALRFPGGPTPGGVQAEGRKPAVRRVPEHPEGPSRAVHGSAPAASGLPRPASGVPLPPACSNGSSRAPPPAPHPRGISRLMGVLKSSRGGRGYLQAYTELRSPKHTCCLDAGKSMDSSAQVSVSWALLPAPPSCAGRR